MSHYSDFLNPGAVEAIYENGYALIPRADPLDLPAALINPDWSYQWFTDGEYPKGWKAVAYQDHPGWFAPPDKEGLVVVNGCRLFRRLKREVEAFHRANQLKSEKLLEGWADRFGMFTGGATALQTDGEEVVRTEIAAGKGVEVKRETFERPATKTVELTSKIPKDMVAYIDQIFAERDRIVGEIVQPDRTLLVGHEITERFYDVIESDKAAPWWPTLHAIILPYAIDNVRKAVFQLNQSEAESTS